MAPAVGVSWRRISFEVVVLPQPLSPMTPRVSPDATAKSMPSTALTQATFFLGKTAVVTGKCLVRPSISNSGGMHVPWDFLLGAALLRFGGLRFGTPAARGPRRADPHLARLVGGA